MIGIKGATGNNLQPLDAAIPVGPGKPGFRGLGVLRLLAARFGGFSKT